MKSLSTFVSLMLVPLMVVIPLQAEPADPGPSGIAAGSLQIRVNTGNRANVLANTLNESYTVLVTDGLGQPVSQAVVAIRLPEEGATGTFLDGAHSAVSYTDANGVAKFTQVVWGGTPGAVSVRITAVKNDSHAGILVEQTINAKAIAAETKQSAPLLKPALPQARISVINAPGAQLNSVSPGTPKSKDAVYSGANPDPKSTSPVQTSASADPTVSVVTSGGAKSDTHGSSKKWIVLALVAVGAGVGAAMALSSKGGAGATTANTGLTIGTPSISVGH